MMRSEILCLVVTLTLASCGGSNESAALPQAGAQTPNAVEPTRAPEGDGVPASSEAALPDNAPGWLTGEAVDDLPEAEYVLAAAWDADVDVARSKARAQLDQALLGDAEQRPDLAMPAAFDPQQDVERTVTMDGGASAVLLAVSRASYAMRLQSWIDGAPAAEATDASTPQGMLAAALYFLRFQERGRFGCLRQQALAKSTCTPADLALAQQQVARVGRSIKLESAYDGGLPVRQGQPLVPAAVRVTWRNGDGKWVPWAGLRIVFAGPSGAVPEGAVATDQEGRAIVQLLRLPNAGEPALSASIDAAAVLGKAAGVWPTISVTLEPREVSTTSGRVAVFIREGIMQEDHQETLAADATVQGLKDRGYAKVQVLAPAVGDKLLAAKGPDLVKSLSEIARSNLGAVDLVVIGEAHSDFASSMGARSLWHEGVGTLRVYDAWSGDELGAVERSTRARGIGDLNAGRRALKDLGSALAEALHELLNAKAGSAMSAF